MESENNVFGEEAGKGLTIREIVLKYLAYYPFFIISITICIALGFLYTRYATPLYQASTLVLIKKTAPEEQKDLVSEALSGKLEPHLNNELVLLRSSSLMERVVAKKGFNISYYFLGKLRKTNIYNEAPFRLTPQNVTDIPGPVSITVKSLTDDGGIVEVGPQNKILKTAFRWNLPYKIQGTSFVLSPKGKSFDKEKDYVVQWNPVAQTADEISSKLTVKQLDDKSSIVQLDILIENLALGKDIVNSLIEEYNLSDIQDRNIVSQNTIRFITDRLGIISKELSGVEGNLEDFQGNNKLIDVQIQSTQSFGNSNDVSKNIKELNIQQRVVQMLQGYFNNPESFDKLVPSTMGLNDPTLSSLITRYNELQLTKQKEAPFETKNSIVMRDLNNQINDVRGSVLEALQNINRNLVLQESNFQQQNNQYNQFLSSLPGKERAMQEIKRKQSITEGLYLYLLQRREEASITSTAANVLNYKQIDPAKGFGPVKPNKNIVIYAAFLGLLLPVGFIYLSDLLNDKINSRSDITSKATAPILGEINHVQKVKLRQLAVMERSVAGEQLRMIRTNVSLLQKKKNTQTILVTSSSAGEGKSFVSMNLAAVLAIPGRKVALLEFDLRKPGIIKSFQVNKNVNGITSYLKGETNDLSEICASVGEVPSLHVYPAGNISTYSGDLLINQRIRELFVRLKQEYDYIIIDSAPATMVGDAFILAEYADSVIYVIRQRTTQKKQLDFINDIIRSGRMSNVGIILNDVKMGGKYGYYGYTDKNYNSPYYTNGSVRVKKNAFWKRKQTQEIN
jgi:capsular exopolysaccharide synthesis family protein